jgi:hypothetical protein
MVILLRALSDERTGLSFVFVYGADSCQSSFSRVRALWELQPYFTVSDLRLLPFSSPPTTHRVTVELLEPSPNGNCLIRVRVRVRVRVTLRLAVYRQSVCLGVRPLEAHDQRLFFLTPCDIRIFILLSS